MAFLAGDLLNGRYRVSSPLALGGAGSVYLAHEEPSGSERAVKQLRADAPEVLASFRDEFALLSRLSHPHLLRVLDFGAAHVRGELHHYYVADRVPGCTLTQWASQRKSGAELLRPVLDALEGLFVLHEAGIRHGDFTPANVVVGPDGRGTLIDLGAAHPFGVVASLVGTEGFVAPELLNEAEGDARADLYSAGQTLKRVFELARVRPATDIARLIERMTRAKARERPADVAEVLAACKRHPQLGREAAGFSRLLGRESQVARFDAWLAEVTANEPGPRIFSVTGAAHSGLTRLTKELGFRAQLHMSVLRARPGEPGALGRMLALAAGMSSPVVSLREVLTVVERLKEVSPPQLIVVEDHEQLDGEQHELLVVLLRSLPANGGLCLVVSGRAEAAPVESCVATCDPLTLEQVRPWASLLVSEQQLAAFVESTAGLPARIVGALDTLRRGTQPEMLDAPAIEQAALPRLSKAARSCLSVLVASGGEHEVVLPLLDWGDLEPLLEAQLVTREGSRARLRERGQLAAFRAALTPAELRDGHLLVCDWLTAQGSATAVTAARVVHHLTLASELERAERVFTENASALRSAARAVASYLIPLSQRSSTPQVLLGLAELLLQAGYPRPSIRAARRCARLGPVLAPQAIAHVADALVRLGRPARAQGLLQRSLAREGASPTPTLVTRLARALLARGDFKAAKESAERALALAASGSSESLAHEALGVAQGYLGDLERSALELGTAALGFERHGDVRAHFRVSTYSAIFAYRAGRLEEAVSHYQAALDLAERHEINELVATALLNLGTAEQQAGAWGSALRRYERGAIISRAIGRADTELTLEYNLANLFAEIGALERAEEVLTRLAPRATALKLGHLELGILLLGAELDLLLNRPERAEQKITRAHAAALASGQRRELFEAELRRVDLVLARRDYPAAGTALLELSARFPDEAASDLGLWLEIARAKVEAALGNRQSLGRLEAVRERAHRERLTSFEASALAASSEAAEALGDLDESRAFRERARRLWDRIAAELPTSLGQSFWRHPRRLRLNELSRPIEEGIRGEQAEAYRRLLSLNRKLNSAHSLERILDYAIQAAVDLTQAERGFLLLDSTVAASSGPYRKDRGPSQSIVRRTLEHEEPVLATDALDDPLFAAQHSVHLMQLKSVLCVPISSPDGTLGAIYVDSSVQRNRFSPRDGELLAAFADQVAIAISNARLRASLEQRTEELSRKNASLEQTSRGQALEVERLKQEMLEQKRAIELRYDYSQIVGRGPAMRRVLERLDRVVDAEVNVLVLGESGTGKELIARAIHANGPRKAGPFVAINCAALPENLLESELFGHVRGAFTGAERDKVGLMQAAKGGTLFLDEIGELPATIQAKLLRVLQEREIRPLGAVASVPLDVRLVTATHRDLSEETVGGAFREDLYYRIAVVTVQLPPLRERLEDLPLLAKQILERLSRDAGRKALQLSPEALRKLGTHPFRGNVRELQNVLTRAFVLSAGSRLRAEDIELEPPQKGARKQQLRATSSRKDFEAQERQRILDALQQSRWNVSAVSSSLGIPRATLHRKLKRYGLERSGN